MGMFKGVESATPFGEGGVYLTDGRYLLQIDACKQIEASDGREFACIETVILRTTSTEKQLQPSCEASVMHKKNRSFLSNVAHFISQAMGIAFNEVDDDGCELAFSEENPLRGTVLRALAKTVKTAEGGDYTKVTFSAPSWADIDLLEAEGIKLPTGKKLAVNLRDDNPIDEEDQEAWVP
jgi:hypothetical protein